MLQEPAVHDQVRAVPAEDRLRQAANRGKVVAQST
jgi:hypothetical protein